MVTLHAIAEKKRDLDPTIVEEAETVVWEEGQDLAVANVVADPPTEDTVAITVKKAVTVITEDVVAVLDHQAMTEIEEEAVEIVTDITTAETEADLQDREEVATIKSAEADPLNKREIPEWKEVRDRDQTAKSTTKNLTEEAHKVMSKI